VDVGEGVGEDSKARGSTVGVQLPGFNCRGSTVGIQLSVNR
jgi:hypothetical protein